MKRDIRRQIINAFRELCVRGLKAVTMDQLADRAGISKRTLYRYFPSKDAVIEASIDNLMLEITGEINRELVGKSNPADKLRAIKRAVSTKAKSLLNPAIMDDLLRFYPHLWQKVDRQRMQNIHRIESIIIEGQEKGQFRQLNPKIAVNVILSAITHTVNPDFITRHGLTVDETLDQIFELVMWGIVENNDARY